MGIIAEFVLSFTDGATLSCCAFACLHEAMEYKYICTVYNFERERSTYINLEACFRLRLI